MSSMTIPVPTLPDLDTLERLAREASASASGPCYWRGNADHDDPNLACADAILDLIGQVRQHSEAVRKVLKMHDTIWYDKWKHEMLSDQGHGGRCGLCLGFDGAACETVLALGGFPDE